MNIGDFFLKLITWIFTVIYNILPNDVFGLYQNLDNFLKQIRNDTISFFKILSLYLDLWLFFVIILILVFLPIVWISIRLISRFVQKFI
jgi:hypothetical protein